MLTVLEESETTKVAKIMCFTVTAVSYSCTLYWKGDFAPMGLQLIAHVIVELYLVFSLCVTALRD